MDNNNNKDSIITLNSLNLNNKKLNQLPFETKFKGPINIALIKYWGKSDEENIIPLNNNVSLTLDMNKYYTETTLCIEELEPNKNIDKDKYNNTTDNQITLLINKTPEKLNSRQLNILNKLKIENKRLNILINSTNSFPTAAGCASSASSGACLAKCISNCFIENLNLQEETILARSLSGSACRSMYDYFCQWDTNGNTKQLNFPKENIKDIRVLLVIVSDKRKDYSSTNGMKISKETSEFLQYRIKEQVNPRIENLYKALDSKDYSQMYKIIMQESNSLHSVCRDTFPPLMYMNDTSNVLIKIVNYINSLYNNSNNEFICGYTFDAGPNCFIFTNVKYSEYINKFISLLFKKDFDLSLNGLESLNKDYENIGIKINVNDKVLMGIIKEIIINKNMTIGDDIVEFKGGEGCYKLK